MAWTIWCKACLSTPNHLTYVFNFDCVINFSKPASGYACKRPTSGEWTTAKPTDLPVGHCPPNHYEFKGYCFKFFGLNANVSEYKNWTMARDVCRDLGGDSFSGNYYDLASVHSDKEQAFLSAIFAEHDPGSENFWEFWIGYRYVTNLCIYRG